MDISVGKKKTISFLIEIVIVTLHWAIGENTIDISSRKVKSLAFFH